MLIQLCIINFALIRELELSLDSGLSIVSGETGAGKSIFLDALGFIGGQRASREMIRRGAQKAEVYALFSDVYNLLPPELQEELNLQEEDIANSELLLYRSMDENGRSTAKVNGRPVNISSLKDLGDKLFNLHAQHEQISLFYKDKQAEILDRYAPPELSTLKESWQELRNRRIKNIQKLKQLGLNPQERERSLDLLNFQIEEIKSNLLSEQEFQNLQEKYKEYAAHEDIQEALAESIKYLDRESEFTALSLLDAAVDALSKVSPDSKKVAKWESDLTSLSQDLSEVVRELKSSFLENVLNPQELRKIEAKLDAWLRISAKYGGSPNEVARYLGEITKQAEELANSEELFLELREQIQKEAKLAEDLAREMHEIRAQAAEDLAKAIEDSLRDLNMSNAKFEIRVELANSSDKQYWAVNGRDKIDYYIATNKGEGMLPLAKVASGGEASRILLAIKSILADLDDIPVLIFDEIDSGISGDTAQKLGLKLKELARNRQVIAVSHTAQIAAMADYHLYLEKSSEGERTETTASFLSERDRVDEVARLMVGNEQDEKALELASKLLAQYNGR